MRAALLPAAILALSAFGMGAALVLGGAPQPDWALALLLAALLARRESWRWVLPALFVHDGVLYWSPWGAFPLACLLPRAVASMDIHFGAGLPQRWVLLAAGTLPVLAHGWGFKQWLLTVLACIPAWSLLARIHASRD